MDQSAIRSRFNVSVSSDGPTTMLFAHGFGCDQSMWRHVAPAFADSARVALFDYVGAGRSDHGAYDSERYASLTGYAQDLITIVESLGGMPVRLVAHSVSSMIGILAAIERPDLFEALVLVCPSPRYVDDGDYTGGFARADIEELLDLMERNPLGWASVLAPMVLQHPELPEMGAELEQSFCRMDRVAAQEFARITFLSDNRADLRKVRVPALILQCAHDNIAPPPVGAYVHRELPNSRLVMMTATGHCPQLTAPAETIEAIREFLGTLERGA